MFNSIVTDVYGLLAAPEWVALNIPAKPSNYQASVNSSEFVRVSILPGETSLASHGVTKLISGRVILSIFVVAGNGDKKLFSLAEKLSRYFDCITMPSGTQFGAGSLRVIGTDSENPALYRGDFSINFKIYGE